MDNREIAMYLTGSTIEWLQEYKDIELERDVENVGNNVAKLYKAILKGINSEGA